ncbi:hypothetical protein GW17_00048141 [Ensete ventricosum]|nr:hypothetical protein GW17_00048141 [Ensete ventricosum]RZS25184.1 hypothetical protein BHM03_00058345 [Ensete ventricosum]
MRKFIHVDCNAVEAQERLVGPLGSDVRSGVYLGSIERSYTKISLGWGCPTWPLQRSNQLPLYQVSCHYVRSTVTMPGRLSPCQVRCHHTRSTITKLGYRLVEHGYSGCELVEHFCSGYGLAKHCLSSYELAEWIGLAERVNSGTGGLSLAERANSGIANARRRGSQPQLGHMQGWPATSKAACKGGHPRPARKARHPPAARSDQRCLLQGQLPMGKVARPPAARPQGAAPVAKAAASRRSAGARRRRSPIGGVARGQQCSHAGNDNRHLRRGGGDDIVREEDLRFPFGEKDYLAP